MLEGMHWPNCHIPPMDKALPVHLRCLTLGMPVVIEQSCVAAADVEACLPLNDCTPGVAIRLVVLNAWMTSVTRR